MGALCREVIVRALANGQLANFSTQVKLPNATHNNYLKKTLSVKRIRIVHVYVCTVRIGKIFRDFYIHVFRFRSQYDLIKMIWMLHIYEWLILKVIQVRVFGIFKGLYNWIIN